MLKLKILPKLSYGKRWRYFIGILTNIYLTDRNQFLMTSMNLKHYVISVVSGLSTVIPKP